MSEFSTGPWQATTTPAGKGKVVDKNGFSVANATATPWTQGLADARLIASAPELLEALTEMLERYVSLVNSGDAGNWNPEDEPQVQQARAAIRKATGAAE